MTIASMQVEGIGARVFAPEGPFGTAGNSPLPNYRPGEVVAGDYGAEFVSYYFHATAGLVVNQGDVFIADNAGTAVQSATGSGAHPFSAEVGTLYLGGSRAVYNGTAVPGNLWSYTFPSTGMYLIWLQRAGNTVMNIATVNAQTKPLNTTAVAGQVNAPASVLAGSMGITGANAAPASYAFTANTTTGSVTLSAVSTVKGLAIGGSLSGTGIPTGAVIKDIQGNVITMSLAATATNTGTTITMTVGQFFCTTTNTSPVLTNVTSIYGVFPNATITGTGISGTVVSITGVAAPYTITMSANSSATANNITAQSSVYVEAMLRWPQVTVQN